MLTLCSGGLRVSDQVRYPALREAAYVTADGIRSVLIEKSCVWPHKQHDFTSKAGNKLALQNKTVAIYGAMYLATFLSTVPRVWLGIIPRRRVFGTNRDLDRSRSRSQERDRTEITADGVKVEIEDEGIDGAEPRAKPMREHSLRARDASDVAAPPAPPAIRFRYLYNSQVARHRCFRPLN
ncbi:hypothetical protein EVAR_78358_1 [Eumeta japonica]|uniref:Uncharacterized protein n=1 Tax=Eumeta variegata TaxID=151549 RepID=A0A4C1T480_EUMVA|nr:hypothetical protein EVAR_78358_1 [Eumeta japonica]